MPPFLSVHPIKMADFIQRIWGPTRLWNPRGSIVHAFLRVWCLLIHPVGGGGEVINTHYFGSIIPSVREQVNSALTRRLHNGNPWNVIIGQCCFDNPSDKKDHRLLYGEADKDITHTHTHSFFKKKANIPTSLSLCKCHYNPQITPPPGRPTPLASPSKSLCTQSLSPAFYSTKRMVRQNEFKTQHNSRVENEYWI